MDDQHKEEKNGEHERAGQSHRSTRIGEKRLPNSQPEDGTFATKRHQDGKHHVKVDRQRSIDTRSNLIGDGSSVYAELRARNLSALVASPGSSLRSINSLSEGQDLDTMRDMDALRQVPVMDSEAQSKQGSNNPSEAREKDAIEKSTMGTTHDRQNLTSGEILHRYPSSCQIRTDSMKIRKMVHHHKGVTPSSLRDSGTQVDIQKMHNNASAGSAAMCQQQYARQGLAGLSKYYIQTQQHHMKTMSSIVNSMAQIAGEMIKQGHNPSSLNMSAAVRACSLANMIIYKAGCITKPPVAIPREVFTERGGKLLKDSVFPAPPGPDTI